MPVRLALALAALVCAAAPASAQLSATISYQGRLADGGGPASGPHEVRFQLFAAAAGGSPLATATRTVTPDADGVFSVADLPFGGQFAGADRHLELAVRPAGSGSPFTVLSPRQAVTAAPVASFAARSGTSLDQAYTSGRTITTISSQPVTILGNAGLQVRENLDVGAAGLSDGVIELYASAAAFPSMVLQNLAGSGQLALFNAAALPTMILENRNGSGGGISLFDEAGAGVASLLPDTDGVGGVLTVFRDGSNGPGVVLDGNAGGSGSARITLSGVSPLVLDASAVGDSTVQLPAASVSADELSDEPGVAHRRDFASVGPIAAGVTVSLGDATLTAPADGFILAQAVIVLEVPTLVSGSSFVREAIGLVSPASDLPGTGGTEVRVTGPTNGELRSVSVTRVFPVSAGATTITARTQPLGVGGVRPTSARIESLTLLFVPSAYGTVDSN